MDLDFLISEILSDEPITEMNFIYLCRKMKEVLFEEGTLLNIHSPISICGDTHGQFYDIKQLFEVSGSPDSTHYLFLGDYVDRGQYSVETISLLFCYKLKFNHSFFMLRGNHESRQINQVYGFYEEIVQRYGHAGLWRLCNEVFDLLPIAALIDNKVFCVHGGLSPLIKLADQISMIERRQELPQSGALQHLVWSDPEEISGWGNNPRGAGILFGHKPTQQFCYNNGFKMICRAHQVMMHGFFWHFDSKQCVTIWSAPNYMYRVGNQAAIMKLDGNLNDKFIIFEGLTKKQGKIPDDSLSQYFL